MGNRAGSVGYLASQPVLQLEGLMMDGQYLDNIRHRRNLLEVLRKYGVRYNISTRAAVGNDGCWVVKGTVASRSRFPCDDWSLMPTPCCRG
jgi:hypothetical protein